MTLFRIGGGATQPGAGHTTTRSIPQVSFYLFHVFVWFFSPKILENIKYPRPPAITVFPPGERVVLKEPIGGFLCFVFMVRSHEMYRLLQHFSQFSKFNSKGYCFFRILPFFTFLDQLFVLHFPIWQARIAFLSANFISMSLFCIKCKTCHSWKLNWTF